MTAEGEAQRAGVAARTSMANVGLIFAMLAFFLAMAPDLWERLSPEPTKPIAQSVRDGVSALGSGLAEVFVSREQQPSDLQPAVAPWTTRIEVAASFAALLAILCAALGFVRCEENRRLVASVALASSALAYGFELKMLVALLAGLLVLLLMPRSTSRTP